MKASRITFLLLFFLFLETQSYCQDTNIVKYLPLKIGNVWLYHCSRAMPPQFTWDYRIQITRDTTINGKKYFYISGRCSNNNPFCSSPFRFAWNRIDSMAGNFYELNNGNPCFLDSLKSKRNDTTNTCFGMQRCIDTGVVTVLGYTTQKKSFQLLNALSPDAESFAKGIGIYQANRGEDGLGYYLYGCIINGIVFGDTNFVGIQPISNELPSAFSLYQNYPNPFNPSTKIRFAIPVETHSNASLRIYDVLGREAATLVNEHLKPGTYEVEWNATDYPSGVYYYTLTAGDFKQTRKMVLIR